MAKRHLRTRALGLQLKGVVLAGTRIYLALALLQFLLGLLFGAGLVLLDYDLTGVTDLLRGSD